MEIKDLVFVGEHDKVFTTSLKIAEVFGKDHAKVLRDVKNLIDADAEIGEANFGLSSYVSEQNKELPMYVMDRDGFTLLVMGYTGKKALEFKKAYIKAFNAMEAELKRKQKALTPEEMFLQSAQIMFEQRKQNGRLLLEATISDNAVPEQTVRDKVRELVNEYAGATNTEYRKVWEYIYKKLYYLHHVQLSKKSGLSKLEQVEQLGHMNKLYDIISEAVRVFREENKAMIQ